MFNPISTYRIQFHKGFRFDDLETIIPYLQQLGIKTIYASPIFKAVQGSMHGYDVTDANQINPEIGTLEQLKEISARIKAAGMSWIQDIVPNHMALHTDNSWLMDVLKYGKASEYAAYFDIDWEHPSFAGKLMLPLLGATLEESIAADDVALVEEDGVLFIKCYDALLPVNDATASKKIAVRTQATLELINNDKKLLKDILDEQHYLLTHWEETEKEINYRRFFTVNSLICLNMQNESVFNAYHKLIKSLCDEGVFQGVRVDHVDGLYDAGAYLDRLRALVGDDKYIVVEKILEQGELFPADWPVQGTTGYDYLGMVNNVFTNRDNKKVLASLYAKETSEHRPFNEMLRDRKALILSGSMQGELNNLYCMLMQLDAGKEHRAHQVPAGILKEVLGEFLIQCPVYKYYGSLPLTADERDAIQQVLARVGARDERYSKGIKVLESILLADKNATISEAAVYFYKRCMQFTGPLMAKGMEDTLMYNYNRLLAHNEVGDTPHAFGYSVAEFHKHMQMRQSKWPATMNATATHDTKRGEDARARLNALSDLAEEWSEAIHNWSKLNTLKQDSIDSNDAYFIYQSIIGSYPMPGCEDDFEQRLKEYIQKAFREAKVHTGWAQPNEDYERKVAAYITHLLDSSTGFVAGMGSLFADIADAGIVNSLAQVLLRLTCPGMPDTYQGTELWDLSMVDPDNRRPVNYTKRAAWLEELGNMDSEALASHLWDTRYSGRVKLWLLNELLKERVLAADTFDKGAYTPLHIRGKYRNNIMAYMRSHGNTAYVVVVPLHVAVIAKQQRVNLTKIDWRDTAIDLPADAGQAWADVFSGQKIADATCKIKDIFTTLPLGLLTSKVADSERRAGILMPVFSLPSGFGIGDFGPEAYKFVDFLADSGQRYWQLLPLSPTLSESNYSPYSSISGMAGNTLFISPELLAREGLLGAGDIEGNVVGAAKINYRGCEQVKALACDRAYDKYLSGKFASLQARFTLFCERQQYWLDDFALFVVIKRHHDNLPWYEWPDAYKQRNYDALRLFMYTHSNELNKVKWLQFIVDDQWRLLRNYCQRKDVQLFGDMPFYVSYDSVDVWAAPHLFNVDKEGDMEGNSGVPPDYFSETGQLWGMPTYAWDAIKADNYQWWIRRLKRNLELFDLVRLDHFRAFEAYWQVPAADETAVNGKWIKGPGIDFFDVIRKEFGGLPFVAEDLGYEMDDVYVLREKTGLPGMKVLQFAWGANMPVSPDTPHNYPVNCFVYTGTHDNNTTRGWYSEEANQDDKKRLERYIGSAVNVNDIAGILARMAYSSVARVAILPIQDVLGYGSEARINMPGEPEGNWLWRMQPDALNASVKKWLLALTKMYNR